MRGFELPTNFSHLWWGRKRLCFKHKNTVGLQIFVRRSIRTLNISTLFRPFTPSPPPPSASSPSPPPPPPPPLLRLLPLHPAPTPPSLSASTPSPSPLHLLPLPLPRGERQPKYEEKKWKLRIQYSAENENRQLEYLPQAAFGCVPERYLLSLRTKSITFHSTSHSFAALTIELWSWTEKKRFHI